LAELLLKVGTRGPDPDWQDGDILVAPNDRRISQVHLEHFCHVKLAGFTYDGRRPDGLARIYREAVCQYRFERVSNTSVRRVNLWTSDEDLISDTPNKDGEYMNVGEYLARQIDHPAHGIFGTPGAEVWYGGNQDFDAHKLDAVWLEVEDRAAVKRADYTLHPWGTNDLKHHLVLKVDDFDEATAATYVGEEKEAITATYVGEEKEAITERVLRRRVRKVDWKALDLGVSVQAVEDKETAIDTRGTKAFVCASVVAVKAAFSKAVI